MLLFRMGTAIACANRVFLSLSLAASVVLPVSGSPPSAVNLSAPPHFQETNKLKIQVPVGSCESTSSHNSERHSASIFSEVLALSVSPPHQAHVYIKGSTSR